MKTRWTLLNAFVATLVLAGCASNSEPTQKEKERMAREQQREAQKQAQAQSKLMREGAPRSKR
jgi:hypothetical protein